MTRYKYQHLHGPEFGVKIHGRYPVTGQVSKVLCRFCLKYHILDPKIFTVPLRADKYSDHHVTNHRLEWESYKKLDDEDEIMNYFAEEAAEVESTCSGFFKYPSE